MKSKNYTNVLSHNLPCQVKYSYISYTTDIFNRKYLDKPHNRLELYQLLIKWILRVLWKLSLQTSPENEPCCMRHSQHHAVHKPRRVSLKSFSETSPEKTRWPHQLPWKSRDPSAVISSLKVTSDSLLWLARLPTLGARSARTLILFSSLAHRFSVLLPPWIVHTVSHWITQAFITSSHPHFPFLLHLHSNLPHPSMCPCFLYIFAPQSSFHYPVEAFFIS